MQGDSDEEYTDEVVSFGGEVAILHTGLTLAKLRARGAYMAGRITVEQFEAEIGRLLEKEASLHVG